MENVILLYVEAVKEIMRRDPEIRRKAAPPPRMPLG